MFHCCRVTLRVPQRAGFLTIRNLSDKHWIFHCWIYWSVGDECLLTPLVSVIWLRSLGCPQSHGATREPSTKSNVRLSLALNPSAPLTLLGALASDLDRCLKLGYVNKHQIVSIARPDTPPISNQEDVQLNNFAPYFLCLTVLSHSYLPDMSTS